MNWDTSVFDEVITNEESQSSSPLMDNQEGLSGNTEATTQHTDDDGEFVAMYSSFTHT